jgi:hypothetical protein
MGYITNLHIISITIICNFQLYKKLGQIYILDLGFLSLPYLSRVCRLLVRGCLILKTDKEIMKKCFFMFLVFLLMLFAMLLLDHKETGQEPEVMALANGDTTILKKK